MGYVKKATFWNLVAHPETWSTLILLFILLLFWPVLIIQPVFMLHYKRRKPWMKQMARNLTDGMDGFKRWLPLIPKG
jgi:hypothetical protein